ncbi:hypothetical protein HK097_001916 [Rhizophlyctis rosea]|uniref:Uncharacterized protein n=1 Tax=Rhizophlyctis rosea TaxID=64517 RepID=A0AAD5SKF3_9FUNG|nr:hypothetical protein HK097_001916 [Rhizophlyctis rosea]
MQQQQQPPSAQKKLGRYRDYWSKNPSKNLGFISWLVFSLGIEPPTSFNERAVFESKWQTWEANVALASNFYLDQEQDDRVRRCIRLMAIKRLSKPVKEEAMNLIRQHIDKQSRKRKRQTPSSGAIAGLRLLDLIDLTDVIAQTARGLKLAADVRKHEEAPEPVREEDPEVGMDDVEDDEGSETQSHFLPNLSTIASEPYKTTAGALRTGNERKHLIENTHKEL